MTRPNEPNLRGRQGSTLLRLSFWVRWPSPIKATVWPVKIGTWMKERLMPRVETHEWVPLPPILGGLALVGGAALPAMGGEKKS